MKFEVVHKGEVIETKEFGDGNYKLGRASSNDIQLRSPQVSKQHALLVVKGNRAAIVDLGSSNGVFVNGILVKKQRLEESDELVIADFKIRIAKESKVRAFSPSAPPAFDGNLAAQLNSVSNEPVLNQPILAADTTPPVSVTPQERLMLFVEQKMLVPYYQMLKSVDWRFLLFSILGIALLSAVLLSALPIVRWGKSLATRESLSRAHTVLSQTVRENYRIITKTNNFSQLTVEAAEASQGFLSAFVIDPKTNTIVAPIKLLNKPVTDIYLTMAVRKVQDAKEDTISIERDSGIWVVAQPIYLFSAEANERQLAAVVLGEFEIPTNISSTFEPMVEAALFAILCSLLAYFLVFKMFSYPICTMQEQLDAALKGENISVTAEAKLPELESLATVINFAVSRLKQATGVSGALGSAVADAEAEDAAFEKSVLEFDFGSSDGVLLLDKDKKVRVVGKVIEELVQLRQQYAVGQNISDACRDQSFAGTAIDLSDRVIQSLGEPQFANLDINGVNRSLAAVCHRNVAGEIRFILIMVKMAS